MVKPTTPPTSQATLETVLALLRPLATWLLRSGVGHADFARASKQVFFEGARQEQQRGACKDTDSALSLLSGLHRKDIRALRDAAEQLAGQPGLSSPSPSLANQVVTRWLSLRWPKEMPFSAPRKRTFENLVRGISRDVHPRSILNELMRLGVVAESAHNGRVQLLHSSFVPSADDAAMRAMLRDNVRDHLLAGVHNLTTPERGQFLEQSVFADELKPESVAQLQALANRLWQEVLQQTVQAATPLCAADETTGGDQRIRLGMFFYSEPAPAREDSPPSTARRRS